jgi:hypothetical protein
MLNAIDSPAEEDVRFLGYRLAVISQWAPSARKMATARAISLRLTSIARCALVRPDIADLLHLSCQLLDDFFAVDVGERNQHHSLDEETVHRAIDVY